MRSFLVCAFLVACSSDPETSAVTDGAAAADTNTAVLDTGAAADSTAVLDTGAAADTTSSDTTIADTAEASAPDTTLTDTGSKGDVGDTSTSDVAADGPDAGCNTVLNKGTSITQTAWTEALPTFSGGTITDGTYVLTKWVATGGKTPSTIPVSETIVISGGSWQIVANASSFEVRQNATATTSGSSITYTPTCPAAAGRTSLYTATATELMARSETDNDISWFTKL